MRLRMEGAHLTFFRTETEDWAPLSEHGRPDNNDDYDEITFMVSSQLRTDTKQGLTQLIRRLSRSEKKDYAAYFVYSRDHINPTQDRVVIYAVRRTGLPKMTATVRYVDGEMIE